MAHSTRIVTKLMCSKNLKILYARYWMDLTLQYLPMDRLDQVNILDELKWMKIYVNRKDLYYVWMRLGESDKFQWSFLKEIANNVLWIIRFWCELCWDNSSFYISFVQSSILETSWESIPLHFHILFLSSNLQWKDIRSSPSNIEFEWKIFEGF